MSAVSRQDRPAQPADTPAAPPPDGGEAGKFTQGSTLRHVLVMTAAGAIGLVAVFVVDFLSLLYISWLGEPTLTAGVGFATIVLFFATSINIGLMIAVGALVSRALGAREREKARRLAVSGMVQTGVIAGIVRLGSLPFLGPLLALLGAHGEAQDAAMRFLVIALPANIFMGLGMALSGVLRAVGDARRSMYVTLSGGIVTAVADPILILGLGWGVEGAATATALSRLVFLAVGLHGAGRVHGLLARPRLAHVVADLKPMLTIALPAILANVATPVANAFVASVMARFGDEAMAAVAIVDRLVPLCFGVVFALSGAVGPILGQNWGAQRFDRMRRVLRDALSLVVVYVGAAGLALALVRDAVPLLFDVAGTETGRLVAFFCVISGVLWLFNGLLFVANASFNNLGFPLMSTGFNWAKATIGTMPFALAGAHFGGPEGVLVGVTLGAILFGVAGILTAFWTIGALARR